MAEAKAKQNRKRKRVLLDAEGAVPVRYVGTGGTRRPIMLKVRQ